MGINWLEFAGIVSAMAMLFAFIVLISTPWGKRRSYQRKTPSVAVNLGWGQKDGALLRSASAPLSSQIR